jgi:hypothetical protein
MVLMLSRCLIFNLILNSSIFSCSEQLAKINEHVVALEKFIRASTRLQSEATAAFHHARQHILAAANMLRKRYGSSFFLRIVSA